MLVAMRGCERTESQYRALLSTTGFDLPEVVATGSWLSLLVTRPVHQEDKNRIFDTLNESNSGLGGFAESLFQLHNMKVELFRCSNLKPQVFTCHLLWWVNAARSLWPICGQNFQHITEKQ